MEKIYEFVLDSDEFEKVLAGKKTVQLVINDSKHKVYAVGNQITFKRNTENLSEEQVKLQQEEKLVVEQNAEIENLLYFADVIEATTILGKETCGFKPGASFDKASDKFLSSVSYEKVEKNGLVALVFKLI